MTGTRTADDLELRGQLSRLNALLVLSMLMTECQDDEQVVKLGASAAPSFAECRLAGVSLVEGEARRWLPGEDDPPCPPGLDDLPGDGGAVSMVGWDWGWAFSLGAMGASLGHLVVAADRDVGPSGHFLLRVLAQQMGVAMRNSRLHRSERAAAEELASVNAQLENTVQALQLRMEIHDRLTRAAVSGEGMDGIARAVHEVTGRTVVIEDRFGNIRAWAGSGEPPEHSKDPPARREQLLRRLLRRGSIEWETGRLIQAVSPRPGSVAVIALLDPDRTARDEDLTALEYGATILSLELARLRSVADTEIRLRRDLVEDLLAGTNLSSAVERGETFQHDLTRPHVVAIFEGRGRTRDDDQFFTAVRRAARERGLGSLLVGRSGTVVLITDRDVDWEEMRTGVLRELARGTCRIGVGGRTRGVGDFPASFREAQTSLNLLGSQPDAAQVAVFDRLGVYRLLASAEDPRGIERFVHEWLGRLLDYDRRRHSELVATLSAYLECGGRYEETARRLSIHRSTLKYRLQRIREVSELALGDPDVDFNLQLACRAWSTLRALRV
ncbi:MAG: helix-turn-helix domain-containing protein [Candidatus Nanopelagicales bacterium]